MGTEDRNEQPDARGGDQKPDVGGPRTAVRLTSEADGAVARITLAKPPLNIMDISMLEALGEAVSDAAADPRVRVLVMAADSDCRAFSAGVDVRDHTPDRVSRMLGAFHRVFRELDAVQVPTVAVVAGPALGGGCELVSSFDLVLAGESATFGQPEIKLGAIAPMASLLLPAVIGPKRAADWLFTGRVVDAREAAEAGLVSRHVPDSELETLAAETVAGIAGLSGAVLPLAKRAARIGGAAVTLPAALDAVESLYLDELMQTADAHEGLTAFAAKRAPRWAHR